MSSDADVLKLQRDVARLKHLLRILIGWLAFAPALAPEDLRLLYVLLDQIDQEDG